MRVIVFAVKSKARRHQTIVDGALHHLGQRWKPRTPSLGYLKPLDEAKRLVPFVPDMALEGYAGSVDVYHDFPRINSGTPGPQNISAGSMVWTIMRVGSSLSAHTFQGLRSMYGISAASSYQTIGVCAFAMLS